MLHDGPERSSRPRRRVTTDCEIDEPSQPAFGAAAAAEQPGPDDVETVEAEPLERLLHFALDPQIEVLRTRIGADRGNDDHAARSAGSRRARDVDDHVEIDGPERRLGAGRAHRRAERRDGDLGRDPAGNPGPLGRRRDMLVPGGIAPAGRTESKV